MKLKHEKWFFIMPFLFFIFSTVHAAPTQYVDEKIDQLEVACQLKIKKQHLSEYFTCGETGQYTITVHNPNRRTCYNLTISDTLPENMSFNSASLPWSCATTSISPNPQTVTCKLPSLAAGVTSILSLTVNVPSENNANGKGWSEKGATNCARVTAYISPLPYPSIAEGSLSCDTVPVKPATTKKCELKIDKQHISDYFTYGETGQYTITVHNPNDHICYNLTIFDTLPENMSFNSALFPWSCGGVSPNPQTVTCQLPLLAAGDTSVLSLTVNVPSEGNANGNGWSDNEATNCAGVAAYTTSLLYPSIPIGNMSCDIVPVEPGLNDEFCEADTMLVLDHSLSMTGEGLTNTKEAAHLYTHYALSFFDNQVGLVSFESIATLDHELTIDEAALHTAIDALIASGGTVIHSGIEMGLGELVDNSTSPRRIIILVTDGRDNYDNLTLVAAEAANNAGVIIYTIGYGAGINVTILTEVAEITGGSFFNSPDGSDLNDIFDSISEDICTQDPTTTQMSGMKFHDMNGNGAKDSGEGPLEGIEIELYSADAYGNPIGNLDLEYTDLSGNYSFNGFAAGYYVIKENIAILPDWTQTFPTTNNGVYFVTLADGQTITDLDFGNANCDDLCDTKISGFKYDDSNHNGQYDSGENKLAGWLIEAIHTNTEGQISFYFDTTGADGSYSITIPNDALPGSTKLREWMQPLWTAVAPIAGIYPDISVGSGEQLSYSFGNTNICLVGDNTGHPNKYTGNYPDLFTSIGETGQVYIQNIGNTAALRVGLIIENYMDTEALNDWQCSSNKTAQQVSCRYKYTIEAGEEIKLPFTEKEMLHSHLTVFAENDINPNNSSIIFSEITREQRSLQR